MSQGSSFFSDEQLICLRNQIMLFRTLKVINCLLSLRPSAETALQAFGRAFI